MSNTNRVRVVVEARPSETEAKLTKAETETTGARPRPQLPRPEKSIHMKDKIQLKVGRDVRE